MACVVRIAESCVNSVYSSYQVVYIQTHLQLMYIPVERVTIAVRSPEDRRPRLGPVCLDWASLPVPVASVVHSDLPRQRRDCPVRLPMMTNNACVA